MSKLYNEAKKRFIEPIAKKIFKPQKTTGTEVISKIKPNVPDNILDKARRDLRLAKRRTAGSEAKLKTTQFEIGQGQKDLTFDYMKKDRIKKSDLKKKKDEKQKVKTFTAPENFNKGGRVGYRLGSPKKSKLKKIQILVKQLNPLKQISLIQKQKKWPLN